MLKKERSGRGIVNKGKDLDRPSIAEETKNHVADSFHVIKKHGYLEKLSRGAMAGYQKRYFVLSGPYLKYYKTDQRKELLAAVDVRPVLLEVGSDARMKAKTLSLRLPHEDARFVLRAESPKDRDAWLRAIAEVQVEAKRDSKPRASEARASTFDGRHVSSLTAASVVPVASSCDTSLLTSVATAPAGRASAAEAAAAEPIDLRDSLSRERSYSAKTADGKAPPAAPATPPPAALGPPCLSFFGC
ncbi:hypothetical protein JL722_10046 [Aureococcus anophagefferens]|nr:hypothetical protein JL722_10046 [Aureococcus anophagefferens]